MKLQTSYESVSETQQSVGNGFQLLTLLHEHASATISMVSTPEQEPEICDAEQN